MKAVVYDGIKSVKIIDAKEPSIKKADDLIIRVTSTAICGSDLHIYHGMVPNLPKGFIIGHEAVGIVEEAGPDIRNIKKGDRVLVPFTIACGHCRFCDEGLYSQCDNSNHKAAVGAVFGYGENFGSYAGAQAQYLRVPYANVGPRAVPEELSDEQALLLTDVLPTAYWAVETAGVKAGDVVVILGCGPIGLTAIKWAIFAGAKRIIAVDYVSYRLVHAAGYGVEAVNLTEHDDCGEYINEITGGGADTVIDCVGADGKMTKLELLESLLRLQGGSKSAIEIAVGAVRKGGCIVLAGVYGMRYNMFPLGDLFSKNISLKMGICPAQAYVDRIMRMIIENKIKATDIITHTLPLAMAPYAYEIFDKKEDNCIKVVMKP
ncbi:MAG: alcohol dehydrogenase catalytic domain-containing protein [Clostridiales bacterium]|nr:alcohol dehydrogenase catalytic domain-containing protein [Clostridiales bacterium]